MDDLHEKSFTFSTWVKLDEAPPTKAEDSVFASGYLTGPSNLYFDDINNFYNLTASGSRIMQTGPRQGLFFNGDNDFKKGGFGINRNDYYMTLFQAIFTPQESGNYQFRCDWKDDYATIWLDLDRDGIFEQSGALGGEKLGGNGNFTSSEYPLSAGVDYKIAIAHGEGWGSSRIRPWIKTPTLDWQIIDPSDPTQTGMFSVTFDGNITNEISPFVFAKHGGVERIALSGGKIAFFHDLEDGNESVQSPGSFGFANWKHLVVSVDHELGVMKVYEDGNESASQAFTSGALAKSVLSQDWYFGQGLVPSSFDEMRVANKFRSSDWVNAEYHNQKVNATLPSVSAVNGAPSFTSISKFTLLADRPFDHQVSITSSPMVFTAVGLPSGIILNPNDGNLSGSPSVSGTFSSSISALYSSGVRVDQDYSFTIKPSSPDLSFLSYQITDPTTLTVTFEVNATGGEDPGVYLLADTTDHGDSFYSWNYRLSLGKLGLGPSSATLGGLAPDQSYYVRIYAENSAGSVWTGKKFLIRTQPLKEHLPSSLAIWFDSEDTNADGSKDNLPEGENVSTWLDKSGKGRDMVRSGSGSTTSFPSIAYDGFTQKQVVHFDGKSRMQTSYNFRGTDTNLWRNQGYSAFGVSRYTGGITKESLHRLAEIGFLVIMET
jgi:hypothetical protein